MLATCLYRLLLVVYMRMTRMLMVHVHMHTVQPILYTQNLQNDSSIGAEGRGYRAAALPDFMSST